MFFGQLSVYLNNILRSALMFGLDQTMGYSQRTFAEIYTQNGRDAVSISVSHNDYCYLKLFCIEDDGFDRFVMDCTEYLFFNPKGFYLPRLKENKKYFFKYGYHLHYIYSDVYIKTKGKWRLTNYLQDTDNEVKNKKSTAKQQYKKTKNIEIDEYSTAKKAEDSEIELTQKNKKRDKPHRESKDDEKTDKDNQIWIIFTCFGILCLFVICLIVVKLMFLQ
ncbi:hypothetical protein CDIK_1023 [Cucumispora dikerogammari]|nr:hypothetical protein CDIK_1023 [Cucumispora dikerogammari]